ncbi:MAG TPA: hypothetical protein VKQ36_06125 [Ktedonobacterales bacterium]|nr:hypothetical protein [Ktedonobacterales bacterium]
MRLSNVKTGHRLPQKLLLAMIRLQSRAEPLDIIKLIFYRPEIFGRPYNALIDTLMRGPSEWSTGERQLFAAFVSRLNACRF